MPIRTRGLTHLALAVRDPERAVRFYRRVFGVRPYWRDGDSIQVLGPGRHDVLAFERDDERAGRKGGIDHFGFRLVRPRDVEAVAEAVVTAGGRIVERGEFEPGQPFVFFEDPDGYLVEVWYETAELPRPRPPPRKRRRARE